MIHFENIDLKHLPNISYMLEKRLNAMGPGGMYMYLHNPLYSHFSKGHAKIAYCEYKDHRFIILAKYVNMFGKIYNRLVGVPFCDNKDLELEFLNHCVTSADTIGIKDFQFTDTEIAYYNLTGKFKKFDLNNLDYYDNVDERLKHISRAKWRMSRKIGMFNPDGFRLLTREDLPQIEECFESWAQWKEGREDFSRGQFKRFFNFIRTNPIDQYAIFGYFHNDRLIWVEIMTKNTPTHWRGEMLFLAKDNLPDDVVRNVSSYGHYRRMQAMKEAGAIYYYVAGAWGGTLSTNNGTLKHKQTIEKQCIKYFRAVEPLICRLTDRTPFSQFGDGGATPPKSTILTPRLPI